MDSNVAPIGIASREAIDRLQAEMLAFPQLEMRTEHYFARGMYLRTIFSPAGSLIVGKVHRTEHFYAVLSGRVRVTIGEEIRELDATRDGPQILTCPPGTKRAVLVLEDAWRMNVHLNPDDQTDLDALERELIEPDPSSPFLSNNSLKVIA